MIQPGFQIDSELLNGQNALHYAADYGQAEVIKYLVGKGAKLDVSILCLPPMCVCVCVCVRVCVHPSVKVSLLKNSQLYYTISTLFLSPLQLPDKHGITALLAAVYEDHTDCVKVLINSVSRSYPPTSPPQHNIMCVYFWKFR